MQPFDEALYVAEMYQDDYYPDFLVDKVKAALANVVTFLELENPTNKEVQQKFDTAMQQINDLQQAFYDNNSEIETVARDSIGITVIKIIQHFGLGTDHETAMRERDW